MRRYFKEVRQDNHTSRFSCESDKVAMHLTCAFGLNEGDVTEEHASGNYWTNEGLMITEITEEEYHSEEFYRICEFYSHVG